jgi:tetratricopeptide (TPR) repeat protein
MGVIQRELRARSIFIAVLSPEAIQSRWVKREVDAAILLADSDDQRIILPIAAKQCDPREIPPFWMLPRWICEPNYSEIAPEKAAKRIIRSLALVSREITVAPVPEKDTETKEGATERGCGLFAQVRYGEALEAYVRALSMDSMYARAWSNKGNALHKLRQFTDALEAYDQALSLAPQTLAIWLNKGIVLADLGQYEDALSAFDHAVTLSPENAYAWKHKGDELYVRAQYPEALDAYNHVLTLESDYAPAWNCKGNALYQMGKIAEAIEAYGRAAESDPFLNWQKRT